jgi:hypothetical protein
VSRKYALFMICCTLAFAGLAGCNSSTGSSSAKDKYVGGKWITTDVAGTGDGWDVVFKENNTFDGYLPGASDVLITGPYSIDSSEKVTGEFVANRGGRVGRIEAQLESGGTILNFKFIETNAFDNPHSVNGVVTLECRGPNPTKKSSGSSSSSSSSGSSKDAIKASDVTWAYQDVSGWKVTANLTSVTVTDGFPAPTICFARDYPSTWPKDPNAGITDGEMWVIAQIGGKWYGSVWEGVLVGGSQCSTTEAQPGQAPFVQAGSTPVDTWVPKSGEKVGFMISTIARGAAPSPTPNERTQIKLVTWP